MLNVIQSHHIDYLFAQLKLDFSQHHQHIFAMRHIVTPNPAVKQWLTQNIAQSYGICSQVQWHQNVNELEWFLYQDVEQDKDKVRKANLPRVVMKWQIYQCLLKFIQKEQNPVNVQHSMYAIVQRIYAYCENIQDVQQARLKRQQMAYWLSEQVAQVFRHYMRFRPEWLALWSNNQPVAVEALLNKQDLDETAQKNHLEKALQLEHWQRALWFYLFADYYQRIQQIKSSFFEIEHLATRLPPQLYIFTVLDLAPTEWQFIQKLSQFTNIYIYHLSATQEYWADSVDPRWKAEQDEKFRQRLMAKYPHKTAVELQDYYYQTEFNAELREDRHPILTRFGKQARDNFSLLVELAGGEFGGEWVDNFGHFREGQWVDEPYFNDSLLGQLQQDIFYLMNPEADYYPLSTQDQSIQFHVCHSTLRQLEVLKEQLSLWLAQSSPDDPRYLHDILVLAPDIQELEPLIRSVFVGKNSPAINVSGILPLHIRAVWQAFIFPMIWQRGRFTLAEFIDWLNLSAIQQFYQLDSVQVERIEQLLDKAGFKRGFDAQHLQTTLADNDHDFRFSFKYAIDRLAMGIAVDSESICPVILDELQKPYIISQAGVQGDDFLLIGILLDIYQHFSVRRDWLDKNDVLAEQWLQTLLKDIQQFQQKGVSYTDQLQKVIKQYDRLLSLTYNYEQLEQDNQSLKKLRLPLWDILQEIQSQLESLQDDVQFTGRIHFSQIGKIRPLPYKLIVLLNMDSGVFPKRDYPQAFDLLNYVQTKLGDRSRLEDHQGAFLDAILQAQQQVWFFYTGFDIESGEVLDPSSILIEFSRHLQHIVATSDEKIVKNGLHVAQNIAPLYYVHPAQPFIAEGYADTQIRRVHNHWFNIAQVLYGKSQYQYAPLRSVEPQIFNAFLQQSYESRPQYFAELVERYQLETQYVIQIHQTTWIKHLRFPASLYLNAMNISHYQGDVKPTVFEPLILDYLEQYQLFDTLLEDDLQQGVVEQQGDIPVYYEPLLPVGKIKQSVWYENKTLQNKMLNRLSNLGVQHSSIVQKIWQLGHIQFNIYVPNTEKVWGRLLAKGANAKHRFAIWIDYLLWLAWLDLGDAGQDYQMVCVFKDKTIVQSGVSSHQARQEIVAWLDLYFTGQNYPILLPADLLLSTEMMKDEFWTEQGISNEGIQKAYKEWSKDFQQSYIKESNKIHPDWEVLLCGLDEHTQLDWAIFQQSCQRYSGLYATLIQTQQEI